MKTIAFCIIFLLGYWNLVTGQEPDTVKFITLKPAEFNLAYVASKNPLLIDVREFFEYKKSRIPNSINIPSSGNLQISADSIDKNIPIFFYCTSGFRSKRVSKFFAEEEFQNVFNLEGGITAWTKDGMAVERKRIKKHN